MGTPAPKNSNELDNRMGKMIALMLALAVPHVSALTTSSIPESCDECIENGLPWGLSVASLDGRKCCYYSSAYVSLLRIDDSVAYLMDASGNVADTDHGDAFNAYCHASECTAPTTTTPTTGAAGDVHINSADGGAFDFKGEHETWYNLLSAANTTINAFFEHVDYREPGLHKRLVHGSYMTTASAVMRTANGRLVTVEYDAMRAVFVKIGVDGAAPVAYKAPFSMSLDDVSVRIADRTAQISMPEWLVNISSRLKPTILRGTACHDGKCFAEVKFKPLANMDTAKVAPHGLIGQAFDQDDLAVIGAQDEYKGDEITTTAMGEGAIEGIAADYEVASKFATDFKYSRWGKMVAAPRDVAKLTGRKIPRVAGNEAVAIEDA